MKKPNSKRVGIVGISGYSGEKVLEILLRHPFVRVTYVSANNTRGKVEEIWPQLKGRCSLNCVRFNLNKAAQLCDLIFLAVPHTVAMSLAPKLLAKGVLVIDLSGDYRLENASLYEKWYAAKHKDPKNIKTAVYGLPELYREKIKKAKLIANPGCYPTAAILALAPLIATGGNNIAKIIIDAKSGVSGAGRKATLNYSFGELYGNFKAYKALNHQHVPEMEQYLTKLSDKPVKIDFVPHLLPVHNGILETIYVQFDAAIDLQQLIKVYQRFYKQEYFVRILKEGDQPQLRNVTETNFCDVGFAISQDKKLVVITVAIDNLVKGAAGQAVQNMNIMCQFNEKEGLS